MKLLKYRGRKKMLSLPCCAVKCHHPFVGAFILSCLDFYHSLWTSFSLSVVSPFSKSSFPKLLSKLLTLATIWLQPTILTSFSTSGAAGRCGEWSADLGVKRTQVQMWPQTLALDWSFDLSEPKCFLCTVRAPLALIPVTWLSRTLYEPTGFSQNSVYCLLPFYM